MKTKYPIILIILFMIPILISNSYSQTDKNGFKIQSDKNECKLLDGFGLQLSNFSGYGVLLYKNLGSDFSIGISGFILYDEYFKWSDMNKTNKQDDNEDNIWNLGFELRRNIYTFESTKVYGLLGFYYSTEVFQDHINNKFEANYNLGLGIGMDWKFIEQMSVFGNLGYKFIATDKKDQGNSNMVRKTFFALGIGLLYYL
jgi:hypothetical protein